MTRKELNDIAGSWFDSRGWKPFPFQKKAMEHYLRGSHGLLNAPTGTGKTYALWVPAALEIHARQVNGDKSAEGLQVLWITPLRALSQEIKKAAVEFCREAGIDIEVGVRTGDTSPAERSRQKKKMPGLLITTPESLHILLASKGYPSVFKNLKGVIVDEWHELLGSKRGVQVELALSRLKTLSPTARIWGISATIGNLQEAKEVLFGSHHDSMKTMLVRSSLKKKTEVISILPDEIETFPWSGHLGTRLLQKVVPIIKDSRTTLVFTNTRSQTEIWFRKLHEAAPELAGSVAMHHGSLSREVREWVEDGLRNEKLKAVICTSSLDLGVDFSPVETVIQVGSPKGVARLMQRAGRSGHSPGKASKVFFLPTHALELVEAAGLREAVKENFIEARKPYIRSFDVLIQYLVTLAVSEGFKPSEILPEILSTFSFKSLTHEEWTWIMNFITRGSQSLYAYDEFRKVEADEEGLFRVTDRRTARNHRMSIGTIVGDAMLNVRYLKGGSLGSIEEWFISRLSPGDVFWFAGRSLELYKIKDMQVLVKKSNQQSGQVPSWLGGRMPLSSKVSHIMRKKLSEAASGNFKDIELETLSPLIGKQKTLSAIPAENQFLIETFRSREGYHAYFYPFEGRLVHESMAALLAYRMSLLKPITFSIAYNDYGFELLSDEEIPVGETIDNELLTTDHLSSDLPASLNETEMARRKFRDIAVISGLVFQGFPGNPVKTKHLQASSSLFYDVFREYEDNNLLFRQAIQETYEFQVEEDRLREALERIGKQEWIWKKCDQPTPFSFPIMVDRLREKLSSEKLEDRIRKMVTQLEKQ